MSFDEQADMTENWLAGKEAFLSNDDLGDSMDTVDNLIKKHNGFETALAAQSDKIEKLQQAADVLLAKDTEHKDHIIKYSINFL